MGWEDLKILLFLLLLNKKLSLKLKWSGKGINEKAEDEFGNIIIECSKKYFRPSEVETLIGDSSKARELLGWVPEITVEEMCKEMVAHDLEQAKKKAVLKSYGFDVPAARED